LSFGTNEVTDSNTMLAARRSQKMKQGICVFIEASDVSVSCRRNRLTVGA